MKKISATILDFAKPLTDGMAVDVPLDVRQGTIGVAITIGNALTLQACGQSEVLSELFERFRKLPPQQAALMATIVRDLVLRRHTLYDDDLRMVGVWELGRPAARRPRARSRTPVKFNSRQHGSGLGKG